MQSINEILAQGGKPGSFEEYLNSYAPQVGELINSFIPHGTHPDMDKYLYDPLRRYSARSSASLRASPLAAMPTRR